MFTKIRTVTLLSISLLALQAIYTCASEEPEKPKRTRKRDEVITMKGPESREEYPSIFDRPAPQKKALEDFFKEIDPNFKDGGNIEIEAVQVLSREQARAGCSNGSKSSERVGASAPKTIV